MTILISNALQFRGLLPQCDHLLHQGADPFRAPWLPGHLSRCAFYWLLCRLDRLHTRLAAQSADDVPVYNWPLKTSRAFLQRDTFDFQSAEEFLLLVEHFLDTLPNAWYAYLTVEFMFRETMMPIREYLIPEQYFPFVTKVFTKICDCARKLNREQLCDKNRLQGLRDVYPSRLLGLLHKSVLVQNQFMPLRQRIQATADSLYFLLQETNQMLDMLLFINPVFSSTRMHIESHSQLSKLFSLTVKTVYFTAGYGYILGLERVDKVLSALVLLIKQSLAALRTTLEMRLFGSKFARRVRKAITLDRQCQRPIRGAQNFFEFIKSLERETNAEEPPWRMRLEATLNSVYVPTIENIRAAHPQLQEEDLGDLSSYRISRGLLVQVPHGPENFPTQNLNGFSVAVHNRYNGKTIKLKIFS